MLAVVFQPVEVLVPLAARFAAVRLLLFHAHGSGIGDGGRGVDDRKGAVRVLFELLVLMAVLGRVSLGQQAG